MEIIVDGKSAVHIKFEKVRFDIVILNDDSLRIYKIGTWEDQIKVQPISGNVIVVE